MKESAQPLAPARPRFKPYPTYKDSGVEWLGEIPAHWQVKRLRSTVTSCQNGVWGDEPDGIHDIPCVRVADFNRVAFRVEIAEPTLRSIAPIVVVTRGLRPGDLLLEKSGGGENQPVGAVVLFDHQVPAVCSNFIARVTIADDHDPRYQTYLHAALYAQRINTRHIKQSTGIQNLDSSSYLNEATGLPPEPEQRAIAAFLDRETARIDALVVKKERLIELLQEKRTALITRAVNKGLDPNAPMKDSGVQWFGNIPRSWKVMKLKHLSPQISGRLVVSPDQYFSDDGVPVIFGTNVRPQGIVGELRRIGFEADSLFSYCRLRAGDLVTVRVGYPGMTAVIPQWLDGCHFASAMMIRQHPRFSSPWLCHVMNSDIIRKQIGLVNYGAAQEQFNIEDARTFVVPFPSLEEQQKIAEVVDRKTTFLDGLMDRLRSSIDRLRELRTALISAAVTGKIDVREDAA